MKITQLIFSAFVLFISCNTSDKNKKQKTDITQKTQQITDSIPILNYDNLAPLLHKQDDKTYVINFWATWCKPCVDELPYFEQLYKDYKNKNVEVLLVSLDFPNQIEDQLKPFIKNNKLTPKVIVLDDPDQNKWIDTVDPSWSGSIPATIIYNKNKRAFYEQSFDEKTLLEELHKFIK